MSRITSFAPIMLLLLSTVTAQSPEISPAEGPSSTTTDCLTYIVNVADCLTYVEAGSNLTKPDKPCCGELAELVNTQPLCLCELLSNSSASVGVDIDVHRALKLQNVCKVDAPPVTLCSVAGYPVAGVPMSSPMSPMPSMSPMSQGMSPQGVVAPSAESEKGFNGASGIHFFHPPFFLVCLAIAFFSPTFFSS